MWRSVALAIAISVLPAGCGFDATGSARAEPVVSRAEIRVLRQSFVSPRMLHRAASIEAVSRRAPIARVRPQAPLASDGSIDSVWSGVTPHGATNLVVVWTSGVVETIERWRCNCVASAGLRRMGRTTPFRFLMLRGAPAITAPSNPGQRNEPVIGPMPPAERAYGAPASVETIRDGYAITLWQYGPHVQAGLLAAAETLPVDHPAFRVRGFEAGGRRPAIGTGRTASTLLRKVAPGSASALPSRT